MMQRFILPTNFLATGVVVRFSGSPLKLHLFPECFTSKGQPYHYAMFFGVPELVCYVESFIFSPVVFLSSDTLLAIEMETFSMNSQTFKRNIIYLIKIWGCDGMRL